MQDKLTRDEIFKIVGLVGKIVYEVCGEKDYLQAFNAALEIARLLGVDQNKLIGSLIK